MELLTRSHVGPDGRLVLDVLTDLRDTDVAVRLNVEPDESLPGSKNGEWPAGFIDETYGSLADDPLYRPLQGDYENREGIRLPTGESIPRSLW